VQNNNYQILVVEDDELSLIGHTYLLKNYGTVKAVKSKEAAVKALAAQTFDLIFIDLNLDPLVDSLEGLELIELAHQASIYSIVISGLEHEESIQSSYERGCQDYISKPFNRESLDLVLQKYKFKRNQGTLQDFFKNEFITQDPFLIQQLKDLKDAFASDRPIFLQGTTGTGKTMVAELLHRIVFGDQQNFVHLNCSEVQDTLIESELFGHIKGAFTGADTKRQGKILAADGGTLFLDEIATMPLSLQQKLLKVLESKTFYPLGSDTPIKSNFRLISATCEDLEDLVIKGKFRKDLYYRIEGYNIQLKCLKNRKEDIPYLIKHFSAKSKRKVVLSAAVKNVLTNYSWPGNVRELKKCVDILHTKGNGFIKVEDLPAYIVEHNMKSEIDQGKLHGLVSHVQLKAVEKLGIKAFFEKMEEEICEHFYKKNNNKVRKTLAMLKISNGFFYRVLGRLKSTDQAEKTLS